MRFRVYILERLIAMCTICCALGAHAQAPSEAQVKAAYVLNFAKFTEWPVGLLGAPGSPLHVCVAGNADTIAGFGEIRGKNVLGREVHVRHVTRSAENGWHACHAIYLDASERGAAALVLKAVAGRPVLTVSDIEGFIDGGGMVGLVLVEGKIRFDLNREAVRTAGMQLRAQLLSLARVVR